MARLRRGVAALVGAAGLFLAPNLGLRAWFLSVTTAEPHRIQAAPAVVFGAAVYADGTLSEAAAQRVAAAALLYRAGVSAEFLVSGTGSANHEVDAMAEALIGLGVPPERVGRDPFGIDSDDTCRHVAELGWSQAVLVSQSFHLPRILKMCEDKNIKVQGFDAAAAGATSTPPWTTVLSVRAGRLARESGLTWLYLLGLYGRISQEAERAGH